MRRSLILLALAVAGAVTAQNAAPKPVVFATDAQPDTLDVQKTSATSTFQLSKSLYDTLVELDRKGKLVAGLAESWSTAGDGLSVTFKLRRNVKFQDGTAFDAGDVAATFRRLLDPKTASPKAADFRAVSGVTAVDASTARFALKEPFAPLLAALASGWGAILPEEKVESGWDFATKPAGTGPYRLTEWRRDAYAQLEANGSYFRGAPKVASVRVAFVADPAVRLQGLLSGAFSGLTTLSSDDAAALKGKSFTAVREASSLVNVLAINNRRPYLSDPRVRRALTHAIDREAVLEVAYGGGRMVGTFMDPQSPFYRDFSGLVPFDPEKARALLRQAGVPANWTLDLALPQPYAAHIQAGEMIAGMLGKVGVKVNIRVVEWGVWLSQVYGGPRQFDLTVIGHTGKTDPDGRLAGYGVAARNYVGYDSSRVAALIEGAARQTDAAKRRLAYSEVLKAMATDAPFVYLGSPYRQYALAPNVKGLWLTPYLDSFDFRDLRVQ